jgi:hypothetical protein
MSTKKDFKSLLNAKKEMQAKRPDLVRLMRFLDEKTEKGIIPKKVTKVPTLQETERYGYERFLGR